MKTKRRVRTMYNQLSKLPRTEEIKAAQDLLAWVLDETEGLMFEDIIPQAVEPKNRLSAKNYAYGVEQSVWVMNNPLNPEEVFINENKPAFTPSSWWKKRPLEEIEEEIIFGEDYLSLSGGGEGAGETVSWTLIEEVFSSNKNLFRTRSQVEKYLKHFFKIDYTDRIEVGSKEREEISKSSQLKTTALRNEIERVYKAEWIATYKKDGDRIWAMRKIK